MARTFVLGSGFSAIAGAPLSREVIPEIFKHSSGSPALPELKSFLDDFLFRGHKEWVVDTGLEEILSRLDLIKHYKPYPGIDYCQVSLHEELLLGEFIKCLSPWNIKAEHPAYAIFVDIIKDDDTIISFNYDLVAETILSALGRNFSHCLMVPRQSGINLLKLHGSINHYYCPVCGQIFEFPPTVTVHPIPGRQYKQGGSCQKMPECTNCIIGGIPVLLRHFIIAPTLFKSYSLPQLRNLWFRALTALAEADMIFFIGYSLPEADILSYQLFDFARRLSNKKQGVYLINGPRLLPGRFSQIYGHDLVNTGDYFEQWSQKIRGCP